MEAKTVAQSRTTMTEVVLPNDTSAYGMILGGKVMHLMDMAGAVAAYRHCRNPVVTVSVDSVRFLNPIRVGQLILLEAFVTRAFTTSMEVEVQVHSEDPLTGEQIKTSDAFLTFVAINKEGRPTPIPPLIPETDEEKRRYEAALERRKRRLEQRSGNSQ
ncbi:MAG TPA: acyl-CoA thioesterase [Acidobacteriota bacterium]|nr:acyl-CoA thioesterase [Acidobacteriota bacterium]